MNFRFIKTMGAFRSVQVLLLANVFPLFGVLFLGYTILNVFLIYWLESAIVGFFSILKVLLSKTDTKNGIGFSLSLRAKKLGSIFFFIIHFGIFMMVHLLFILAFFSTQQYPIHLSSPFALPFSLLRPVFLSAQQIWIAVLLLFCSHGYSFYTNYYAGREAARFTTKSLMVQPYRRVIVMHLSLLFGGFFYISSGQPFAILLLLIVVKISFDIFFHLMERKNYQ